MNAFVTTLLSTLVIAGVSIAVAAGCQNGLPPQDGTGSAPVGYTGAQGYRTGPCDVEGETIACHKETGRAAGVVNCFLGTQTCTGGQWGDCGTGGGTLVSIPSTADAPAPPSGGLRPMDYKPVGTSDAGGCANNPCNPYCMGIDVDAGNITPGSFTGDTPIMSTTTSFSLLPAPKTAANTVPTCDVSPLTSTNQCSYDMCCDRSKSDAGATKGVCVPWPEATGCSACNGPDYEMAVGCVDSNGDIRIAVCNRGTQNSPTTGNLNIVALPGNPPSAGTAAVCAKNTTGEQGRCTIDLSKRPIPAGKCIDLNFTRPATGISCTGNFSNGNRALMINDQFQLSECNYCNNFSFNYTQQSGCQLYGTQPPPPAASTYTYVANCPAGTRVRWNQLGYATAVPNASEVFIYGKTAEFAYDGGVGAFSAKVTLAHPATTGGDPAVCAINGVTTGCPKNLYTLLGPVAARNPILQLDLSLIAITASPTVSSWQLSYSCLPSE
jgi:hypothetical protein